MLLVVCATNNKRRKTYEYRVFKGITYRKSEWYIFRSSRKEGEMLFGIMSSIAGYEKDLIKERMVSGRITKVQNGERLRYGASD